MAVTGRGINLFKCTAAADSVIFGIRIKSIRWVCGAAGAAGDTAILTDLDGVEIFKSIADGQYYIDIMPLYKWVNGFIVSQLDEGEIYVNVE